MNIPNHIGIIPDGNRRFARKLMKTPWKGHEWGARKVEEVSEWCRELGVKELTIYSFSLENMNRPKREFNMLMKLFEKEFRSVKTSKKIHGNRIRVNVIGRIELLPENVQKAIKEAMECTKNYNNYIINFAMAYGGRQEIVDACKNIAQELLSGKILPEQIDERIYEHHLYLNGQGTPPDLIIRTGGEKRLSNFFLWQSAYSELAFIDSFWPELRKEEFVQTIRDFSQRERRFGK